jgi:hypothetical protein
VYLVWVKNAGPLESLLIKIMTSKNNGLKMISPSPDPMKSNALLLHMAHSPSIIINDEHRFYFQQ